MEDQAFIVVGVDGSAGADAALDFALAEGAERGCIVEVVTAWLWISALDHDGHDRDLDEARAVIRDVQDVILAQALGRVPSRPEVVQSVVHDYAGRVLSARASGATMLVVGGGTTDGTGRKPLGSVAEYCVRHSSAPVVVVPEPERVRMRRAATAPIAAAGAA